MSKGDKQFLILKEIVGEAHVVQDPDKLKAYTIDGKKPKAIVFPNTIGEVSKIVNYASQEHLAIVPRGNGTKMGMGGIPKKMDIVLSTGRLNRITDSDTENLTLSAECGMTLDEVQRGLAKKGKGYFLPLDPPFTEQATLGGIVATNSSGPRRLLYGTARDITIGIKAVFPNGDIVVSGGKTVKNVSGYDMCKLLIGSFGSMAIICEITFKLLPLPEKQGTLLVPFMTLGEAYNFVHKLTASQLLPASIETFSPTAIQRIKKSISIPMSENYLVAIGLEGVVESVERQILELTDVGKQYGADETILLDSEEHHIFWKASRNFFILMNEDYPNLVSLKSNFLISKWREILECYEKLAKDYRIDGAFICHSGNGILYSFLPLEKNLRSKEEPVLKLIGDLTQEAVKREGNLVAEALPLSIKKKVDVWGQRRNDFRIVQSLKEKFDPKGILNPGRFVGGI